MKIRRYLPWGLLVLVLGLLIGTFRPYQVSESIIVVLYPSSASSTASRFEALSAADIQGLLAENDLAVKVEEKRIPPGPPLTQEQAAKIGRTKEGEYIGVSKERLFRLTIRDTDRLAAATRLNAAVHIAARALNERFVSLYFGVRVSPVEAQAPERHFENELVQRVFLAAKR